MKTNSLALSLCAEISDHKLHELTHDQLKNLVRDIRQEAQKELGVSLEILPADQGGSHRTTSITGLTVEQITERIGFAPNIEDDPYKVENSWGFTVNGVHCGVWDYKGSHKCAVPSFSAYGPIETLRLVFGGAVS